MKVLSWDVGIINLAYCMIEYHENNWKILDWGIINLTDREKLKCCNCCKNASCYTDISNNEVYYCKKHLPKDLNPPEFENYFKENKNTNCVWSTDKNTCIKKSKYQTIENVCYCSSHSKSIFKRVEDQYKIKPIKKKAVSVISIDELKHQLISNLEARKSFLEANTILIENQPSMKNPKMKAISSTIYDYFLIRGIYDKERTKSNITRVKFMSPSNKLKLADEGDTKKLVKLKGDDAKTYKLTKSLGIKYCQEMIKPFENWKTVFNQHKKKDDLADSFLQGMYYFNEML
jgi:hypothetical protein